MKKKVILLGLSLFLSLPIFAQNIFKAAQSNDVTGIKFLLNYGVNINTRDVKGNTPLIIAVKENQLRAADFLIEKDADINLQDNEGNTALIAAVHAGNTSLIKTLIQHGADAKIEDKNHKSAADYAKRLNDPTILSMLSASL